MESLDPCISVPLRWSIGNNITKAVRNMGFRGWRRNRSKLRDDEDEDEAADSAEGVAAKPKAGQDDEPVVTASRTPTSTLSLLQLAR